jgi:hypothetical protein
VKKILTAAAVLLLAYGALAELAWRCDFMAAMAAFSHGRPLLASAMGLFFVWRGLLIVIGPPLLAALSAVLLLRRLTPS